MEQKPRNTGSAIRSSRLSWLATKMCSTPRFLRSRRTPRLSIALKTSPLPLGCMAILCLSSKKTRPVLLAVGISDCTKKHTSSCGSPKNSFRAKKSLISHRLPALHITQRGMHRWARRTSDLRAPSASDAASPECLLPPLLSRLRTLLAPLLLCWEERPLPPDRLRASDRELAGSPRSDHLADAPWPESSAAPPSRSASLDSWKYRSSAFRCRWTKCFSRSRRSQ
mmetsp:Transcript_5357/g.17290  ORF Transcript_5357/g.17290 Transcript_5357/m.17290 type:complete len:225 (+) Transcript_5357:1675-2349(+)